MEHNARVIRVTRKRVTGWLATCSCGQSAPKVRYKKRQAVREAAEHLDSRKGDNRGGLFIPEKVRASGSEIGNDGSREG